MISFVDIEERLAANKIKASSAKKGNIKFQVTSVLPLIYRQVVVAGHEDNIYEEKKALHEFSLVKYYLT